MMVSSFCSYQLYKVDQGVQGDLDASLTTHSDLPPLGMPVDHEDVGFDASGNTTLGENKISMAYQDL